MESNNLDNILVNEEELQLMPYAFYVQYFLESNGPVPCFLRMAEAWTSERVS
jgi:hypothetical protein